MKVMIFGSGDLVQRVVPLLGFVGSVRDILIVCRDSAHGRSLARLFSGCLDIPVRHVVIEGAWKDHAREQKIAATLRYERPDLIFHASSIISPWLLPDVHTPASTALLKAGFGLMLPAQLPLLRQVMRAVRDVGLNCPVVNASYPDLTHSVLAIEGLEPTVGVGNSGMLLDTIAGEMRGSEVRGRLQLFAHHSHVTPFATSQGYAAGCEPWLFQNGQPLLLNSLAGVQLPLGRLLNILTARHAVSIMRTLLGDQDSLYTSAPGPLGLAGGWPVVISSNSVALDLPPAVSLAQGNDFQARAARADGVAGIATDGSVQYTDGAKAAMAEVAPDVAEPFHPSETAERLLRLNALLTV